MWERFEPWQIMLCMMGFGVFILIFLGMLVMGMNSGRPDYCGTGTALVHDPGGDQTSGADDKLVCVSIEKAH